jgi:hypothetical protein
MRSIHSSPRFGLSALLASFVLSVGGCGNGVPLHPASGKISSGGVALAGGAVTLTPDASKGNKSPASPTGQIGSDGAFTLMTDGKPGAPLGWYKVTVFADTPGGGMGAGMGAGTEVKFDPKPNPAGSKAAAKGAAPRVDPKDRDPAKSDLSVEVLATPPAGGYEIKIPR